MENFQCHRLLYILALKINKLLLYYYYYYMLEAGYLGHRITPSCVLYVGCRLPWTQDYA